MKGWYKQSWLWCIVIVVLLLAVLVVALYGVGIRLTFLKRELFWSILGIGLATVISIWTHYAILHRDKKINTIQTLSAIRSKYPNMKTVKTAGCSTEKELAEKRGEYLKEMEFFSVGIQEGVFDLNITAKMSGHLLINQYDEYMVNVVKEKKIHEWAYQAYPQLIEVLRAYCKRA